MPRRQVLGNLTHSTSSKCYTRAMDFNAVQAENDKKYELDLTRVPHAHGDLSSGALGKFKSDSKVRICVSGAAETGHCGLDSYELAKELGREIVRQGAILVTGATTGIPLYAAVGAKEEGGFSIGFSPAASEREHVEIYRLPTDYMDIIIYTGFGFPGRDLLLTRYADAVILGCGRVGTIHEFVVAYEDKKQIGILEGSWHTDEVLKHIMRESNRPMDNVVSNKDPKELVAQMITMAKRTKLELNSIYRNYDGWAGNDRRVV